MESRMLMFNNNKGQQSPLPMAGDIAAIVVYSDEMSATEKGQVRLYLDRVYRFADVANN